MRRISKAKTKKRGKDNGRWGFSHHYEEKTVALSCTSFCFVWIKVESTASKRSYQNARERKKPESVRWKRENKARNKKKECDAFTCSILVFFLIGPTWVTTNKNGVTPRCGSRLGLVVRIDYCLDPDKCM